MVSDEYFSLLLVQVSLIRLYSLEDGIPHPMPEPDDSGPLVSDSELTSSLSDDINDYSDHNTEPTHSASSSFLEPPPFKDIGALLNPSRSIESICETVSNLSNDERYKLLYHHVQPPSVLPTSLLRGSNRKFSISWLEKHRWLLYSPKLDSVFCGPCSVLLPNSKRRDKGLLVNRSYSNWAKISNALVSHSSLRYHRDCLQEADILKGTIENPASRLDVMVDNSLQARMNENKHIIRQIVQAVVFLAKQGLPLRGDVEDIQSKKNPGNFLALLKEYATTDQILFNHLNNPKAKNATYISPSTQNDIINVIGYDLILCGIIAEVKAATFFLS